MRRAIQRHIENPLSIHLLQGDFSAGDLVVIDEADDRLEFSRHHDQASDYVEATASREEGVRRQSRDERYPAREYYDAEFEDEDFADFLSQTDDDDEFDPFPAPPHRRPEDVDRLRLNGVNPTSRPRSIRAQSEQPSAPPLRSNFLGSAVFNNRIVI